jgi:hypothetical protein
LGDPSPQFVLLHLTAQLHTHSTDVQFIEFPMKQWGNLGSFVYNLQIFACGGPYHGVEHTPDIAYVEGQRVGGSDPWFLIFAVSYLGGTKVRGPVSYFQSFLFSREYGNPSPLKKRIARSRAIVQRASSGTIRTLEKSSTVARAL